MADWRYIKPKMWSDPYFSELSSKEKLLFIYLFSSKDCLIRGTFPL